MPTRDVIVIGASSGGVEALIKIVKRLPEHLAAAIFVVLHVRPDAPSHLPAILNRAGVLPAAHAVDNEPVRRGRMYIAPPGFQTYVHKGRLSVRRGPHENLHRPAIDPLFRTAAHHYGSRVVGVVLSGALDDGTAGLLAVKRAGGTAIVQDPDDATMGDMPENARRHVDVDFTLPAEAIGPLLVELASTEAAPSLGIEVPLETQEEAAPREEALASSELGPPSQFTCPECQGTLYEIDDGEELRFRCRVGHAYSSESMVAAQNTSVERALWSALRALEERSALMERLAYHARQRGHAAVAEMFKTRAVEIDNDARTLHHVITAGRGLEAIGHDAI